MRKTIEHMPDAREGSRRSSVPESNERGPIDAVWRLLCSTRLALYLILTLVVASLAGALLIQVPAGITPAEYSQWLDTIRPRFGVFTNALSFLGLFDVFRVWWFRLLLGLLTLSVAVCTLDRWPRAWQAVRHPSARTQDALFAKAANRASFSVESGSVESGSVELGETEESTSPVDAAAAVEGILRGRGYRVRREDDGESAHLYADRNWFGRLGTFLNHTALLLILAGSVASGIWGFRDRDLAIPEGSTRLIGHDTKLSMKVESFVDEYYAEGPPKDYRSEVVLYDDGVEVRRAAIRVNEPLSYDGIRFYQSYFGPAVVLQVKDPNGKLVYNDGVPLIWRTTIGDRPVGSLALPSQGLSLEVVAPSSARRAPDVEIPAGQVRLQVYRSGSSLAQASELLALGKPKTIGDLEYTFVRERQFTGLQAVRDPGSTVIWVASALMVLGLMLAFYFPHRRLWARFELEPAGQTRVSLGAPSSRAFSFAQEFREIAEAIHGELATPRAEEPDELGIGVAAVGTR